MLVGVLVLVPVDGDMDAYDTFTAIFFLLAPVVLAGGFHWDAEPARGLRWILGVAGALALAVALLPWPPFIDHLGRGHAVGLLGFAAVVTGAARLPGRQAPLRDLLTVVGD
jgi:peptidoglycan/LPS O-acetylase OafA/YrhL